jgi:hypothetical protein
MSPTSTPQDVTNVVAGKVLHKETGDGVADLLVELFDIDDWADPEVPKVAVVKAGAVGDGSDTNGAAAPGDVRKLYASPTARVCSGWTDSSGGFRLEFSPRDFNVRTVDEQRPDLVLVVLAPEEPGVEVEKRVLYLSGGVRWNAGSREAYIIRLSTALLEERGIPIQQGGDDRTQQRVSLYVAQRESERDFNSGAASYHGGYATQETSDRKQFRDTFVKSIATDFSAVPVSGVMVQEGDNIQEKNGTTIAGGIAKMNDAVGDSDGAGVPVNLYLTPADRDRLHQYFDNAQGEFVEIPESELQGILFRSGNTDNAGALIFQNSPISAFLSEQSADEACAKVHTGLAEDEPGGSGESNGNGSGNGGNPLTDADIPRFLARMVSDMQSPDSVLSPAAKRADQGVVDKAVNAFALQKGPAENPAFWDFDTLQIAFDHVWKQLLDETIPNLAYTANTIAKGRFGIDSAVSDVFNNGLKLGDTFWQMTPVEVPPVVARFFDITKEEFNELSFAMRDQLVAIAAAISMRAGTTIADLRIVQTLTEQGDRLIDTVRHDDVYTLHKTLRELEAKLNGTYEFTVFAADKDYHSVNFGLVVTYREKLTPLMYQAGQLVKSIPLAPKEERKYSVKVTRNEKRSSKEARKNNSSLTTEQSETARVEAEIIKKAQTKTTFSATAEGDYDIGISSGKGTTSFGVEAIGESAQNRKDIRDSLQKAVQAYTLETSTEVVTETDYSQEYNESGTISNPNDELAVTYLFYELQKRYRVSESVYRVMPSVLVAQEMPLPSQITEAWVIAHDWILNRYLLDDSFRPTLLYLANNSVGDDFALRELRKNLRQQRNLVDTLRIEFSSASVEAENRYKALEGLISDRIDEEHTERTDGFGHDIWDFFGGGGQDPEAAKARELAAQDAHQYAVQKAEKAAAALRDEVTNLHSLTDQYNKTLQTRLDNETRVKRLLEHICSNITYYMHGVWSMEPPDQRYLRLYKVQVPVLELASRSYSVRVAPDEDIFESFREPGTEKHRAFLHGTLVHNPDGHFDTVPLVQVADVGTLIGCMGNYLVFPLKQHNALTEFMAAPYIDSAFGAMDPDQLSNVTLDEYSEYVCRLHDTLPASEFDAMKPKLKAWLEQLLASPLRNGDEIVVPTHSLFIETLADPNPILEDYKLIQRELDVLKVGMDVRTAGIESLRRAARLLKGERGDPDFDKQTIVAGLNASPSIDVNNL